MLVFLHIPKTAGSTFNFILENSFGISACHTNHTKKRVFGQRDFDLARKLFPFLRSICGHNLIDPLSLSVPDPFYMTFVREPVARVLSQYRDSQNLGQNRKTFEESVREDERYENLHVKMMAGERNLDKAKYFLEKCGFVGLTQKFDLSLHVLDRLSPCKLNLKYKRRRVTPLSLSKAALESDDRVLELAREYNKLDLALYEFAVKEIFPRLCEKAGMRLSDNVASFDHYASEIHPKFLAFSLYNMLFYRQLCKTLYRRTFRTDEI